MGTPDFAVPVLEMLIREEYDVVEAISQPDRPKGRKKVLTPPPLKIAAEKLGIPVYQPIKMRATESVEHVRQLQPDLIVTAAYGQILPKQVLDLPPLGCINVHASLLPKYRGGAPIQHAIVQGESVTGVTIMYMAEGLDTGDILTQVEVPIEVDDTAGSLFDKLSRAGTELLRTTLPDLIKERITPKPQQEDEAVYAPNIRREDERIRWNGSARDVYNQIRGLYPIPGSYTTLEGKVLKVKAARIQIEDVPAANQPPGTVLQHTDEGLLVQTGSGSLWLTEFQLAGKKAMSAADFRKGKQVSAGTQLV